MDDLLPPLEGDDETAVTEVVVNDDGSVDIVIGDEDRAQSPEAQAHDANLAEFMSETDLGVLSNDLMQAFDQYLAERKDWEDTFREGLKILGVKLEEVTEPFPGSCAAHSPLMLEAALQFQARAITELFPAGGPVKTQILGSTSPEVFKQAQRVKEFMNYQVTEEMEEYFDELDTLLFQLPLAGSAFKKLYFDQSLKRPTARFVPAEYMVVPYATTNLRTCPLYAQVAPMEEVDYKKHIASGFYRDTDLSDPVPLRSDDIRNEKDDIAGQHEGMFASKYEFIEFYAVIDLKGYEQSYPVPYVITIERNSGKVLAIRRNWDEDDPDFNPLVWHVHYKFLPGLGFYGLGLVHILGNLQKTTTALTRSLVDSGQFANLQAGFKAKGARIESGERPLKFGEFRNIEGYSDDIRKALMPLPTKEPSQTLLLMLGQLTDNGRRIAAVADMPVSDMNKEAPVGTTLALMEQGMKVMSAIHKRLHRAQRAEFKILARLNSRHLPDNYPFTVEDEERVIAAADFDRRVDVLPVSDPNIFSEAQRILRAQTQLQLAQQFPQQHNLVEALRRMHEVIGTQNIEDVLHNDRGPKPMDPATEYFALMNGQPIKAYAYQQHQAHLAAHMAQVQMLQGMAMQNPALQQSVPMLLAHVAEHQAFMIRQQIEAMTGMQLPPAPDYDKSNPAKDDKYQSIPPELEGQVAMMQGQAFQQLAALQQAAAQQQQQQDPLVQAKLMDSQAKMIAAQAKAQEVQTKPQLELKKHSDKMMLDKYKVDLDAQLEREQMQADKETVVLNQSHDHATAESQFQRDTVKEEQNFQRELARPPAPAKAPKK